MSSPFFGETPNGRRVEGGLFGAAPASLPAATTIAAEPVVPAAGAAARMWPALVYLFVECARPMAWAPALGAARPGLIAAVLLVVVASARRRWFLSPPILATLWLVFLMAAQVPFATNNFRAFVGFQEFAVLAVGCVLPAAALAENVGDVKFTLAAYVFLHVPMAIFGLLHGGAGMGAWLGDENDLALALDAAIAIGVYLFFLARGALRKGALTAVVLLCVLTVAATLSRGGFVGLVAIFAFLLITGPRRGRLVVFAAASAALLATLAPPEYWGEVKSIETADKGDDTGAQRIYFWKLAAKEFADHPVFGVGTRNFGIVAPLYEDQVYAEQSGHHIWGRVCHSIYFTILAEQGLAGLIPFALIVCWCFLTHRRIVRAARGRPEDPNLAEAALLSRALAGGLVAVLSCGAVLSAAWYPPLWIFVGLMAALARVTIPAEARG